MPSKNKSYLFILFFISLISGLYQIFLIKQLSITNTLYSLGMIINGIISLTLASLGFGVYINKIFKKFNDSLLFGLIIPFLGLVNIFVLKFNFNVINISNFYALLVLVFSTPFIIMGVIFFRIYNYFLERHKEDSTNKNDLWIGFVVFTHSLGFISGSLFSVFLIKISGANILLPVSMVFLIILFLYQKFEGFKHNLIYLAAILFISVLFISFYNAKGLNSKIEKQRNMEYVLWPSSTIENKHLFSGWSPYSKIDIFSYGKDCIGGVYNYKQQWVSCTKAEYDFDIRKILYSKLNGRILLIGSGGGMGCLTLKEYANADLTCIEIDPLVVKLMKGRFSAFNKGIYNKVETKAIDGRFYLENAKEKFDYIIYEGTDFTVSSKIKSLIEVEDYLYTHEAIQKTISLLKEDGSLIIAHAANGLPFAKIKKVLILPEFRKLKYLYYDFKTIRPISFSGKILILSKDSKKIGYFDRIFKSNENLFKPRNFDFEKNYKIVTDDSPFLYFKSNKDLLPLIIPAVVLVLLAFAIIQMKKSKLVRLYFLMLGVGLVLIELFIITKLRSIFFDYITTFVIVNSIIMVSFSLGSLFYREIKRIILWFPIIALFSFLMIYNLDFSWNIFLKLTYTVLMLAPLFLMLGAYFPLAIINIKMEDFTTSYLLDSLGSSIGFFIFYLAAIVFGIKYNFILGLGIYSILSIIITRIFK